MKFLIASVALIAVYVLHVGTGSDLTFNIEYFWGQRHGAVVKLNYKAKKADWPRQPAYCYGALINWMEAVVPCSCVAYTNDASMSSPWFQAAHGTKVKAISTGDIMVGLMSHEHSPKEKTEQVAVTALKLHSKCDATFQVDYALLTLERKLENSRLAWINSPDNDEFRKQTERVSVGSAIGGNCVILRWSESIPSPGAPRKWEVIESSLKFQHWDMCLPLVCPLYQKDGTTKYDPKDLKQCQSKTEGKRYCLTWVQEISLCDLVPGTPVWCDVGDIRGLMGLVNNFTSWCPYSNFFNGIMEAFGDAFEIAYDHLRVRNSQYYSRVRFN
ncbi:hypothetical protein GE061_007975 [Apolygus lucorum]|uniref:AMOP domain-containing protein n=1 Tax=Apolygus lucorum TaxID=248454 RepID=A0A8S9WQ29_APOLU|nr:hypothetical protein GE061_007975 [Apolygus lucorum]